MTIIYHDIFLFHEVATCNVVPLSGEMLHKQSLVLVAKDHPYQAYIYS